MSTNGSRPTLKIQTSHGMAPPRTTDMAASTPAADGPRPILKLNTGSRQSSFSGDTHARTPSLSAEKKIRIKVNSQPSTPAPTPSVTMTKAGRTSKPSTKLVESRKRTFDDSDEDKPLAASRGTSGNPRPAKKMFKINTAKHYVEPKSAYTPTAPTPISGIRLKQSRGEKAPHTPGDAYDSEAEDKEQDPQRENVMILRTIPGPSTEYLHKMLESGMIGAPKPAGGADFSVQFIDSKERRAFVTVNGVHYAAVLVDLPTITEAMKTWDKKAMMKNSDITQMLLCFAEVRNEQEAKNIALPAMVQKTDLKWPHGLTPPMHDAANRRFRKGMSEKQLMNTTEQVKKLLADDDAALETSYEYIHEEDGMLESGDEDAEGEEEDYFGPDVDMESAAPEFDAEELQAELEAEFNMEEGAEGATPATQMEAPTPMTGGVATPAPVGAEASEGEGEDEEDVSEEESDEDDDEDVDEDDLQAQNERKEQMKELRDLEKKLKGFEEQFKTVAAKFLQQRLSTNIQNCKKEIALKKAALGITDDE